MTDIDFAVTTMVANEYSQCKCMALIEYKYFCKASPNLQSASVAAMTNLANRANVPFFVVRYDPDDWTFYVIPLNNMARAFVEKRVWMEEREYTDLLHKLRGLEMPQGLCENLETYPLSLSYFIPYKDATSKENSQVSQADGNLSGEKSCADLEKDTTFPVEDAIRG